MRMTLLIAFFLAATASFGHAADEPTTSRLYEGIFACEAAAAIANSMGDVVEGMRWQDIEKAHGLLTRLLPQDKAERLTKKAWGPDFHYHAHHRPAGMGEDGMERHRLMVSAILRKGGRATIDDLARTWVSDIDPTKFGYLIGPQDQVIYLSLRAGMPPPDVGRYAAWPGFIGTSKMIIPVGVINAGNPEQAARDAIELGRIKDVQGVPGNYALEVAAAIAAGAAYGFRRDATVEGVIDTVLAQLSAEPRREVEQGLKWAAEHKDWKPLRPLYQEKYEGRPISNAVEILSSALAVFRLADGNPREAIIMSVNLGRDCDCRAYVASGLSAALRGGASLDPEWIRTVEEALRSDPYTVSRRSLRESTDGLYKALRNEMRQGRERLETLEALDAAK